MLQEAEPSQKGRFPTGVVITCLTVQTLDERIVVGVDRKNGHDDADSIEKRQQDQIEKNKRIRKGYLKNETDDTDQPRKIKHSRTANAKRQEDTNHEILALQQHRCPGLQKNSSFSHIPSLDPLRESLSPAQVAYWHNNACTTEIYKKIVLINAQFLRPIPTTPESIPKDRIPN